MPPKRTFDAELASLDALHEVSPDIAQPELVKALGHRNNLIVARAAAITLHHQLTSLNPILAEAFPRFLQNAAKSDPQCWAKNALAKTLAAFEYQESELFSPAYATSSLSPGGVGQTTLRGHSAVRARWPWCNAAS
jgi:hypothetical protein